MAFRTYNLDTIIHAIPQTISFMNFDICSVGMRLALEDGLADLKEFIDPQEFTGIEFELLDTLENETIKIMMDSLDKMHKAIDLWFLLNGLCDWDLIDHIEGTELAQKMFNLNGDLDGSTYEAVVFDIQLNYANLLMILFLLGLLYTDGGIDLEGEENFEALNLNFFCGDLTLLKLLDRTEKNVTVLYDLIVELNLDYIKILRLNE